MLCSLRIPSRVTRDSSISGGCQRSRDGSPAARESGAATPLLDAVGDNLAGSRPIRWQVGGSGWVTLCRWRGGHSAGTGLTVRPGSSGANARWLFRPAASRQHPATRQQHEYTNRHKRFSPQLNRHIRRMSTTSHGRPPLAILPPAISRSPEPSGIDRTHLAPRDATRTKPGSFVDFVVPVSALALPVSSRLSRRFFQGPMRHP